MLVLSRKKNESIVIDKEISITVIEIRGDKVRLGIEAPKEITVHRQEVYRAIQRKSKESKPLRPPENQPSEVNQALIEDMIPPKRAQQSCREVSEGKLKDLKDITGSPPVPLRRPEN